MKRILICLLNIFPIAALDAATITATSTSQSDVQAAVNSAASGDTVLIPAGSSTWGAAVTVNKPIVILGAGPFASGHTSVAQTLTNITNSTHATSGNETACFSCSLDVDQRLEIGGIHMIGNYIGNTNSNGIQLIAGAVLASKLVIHDCTFDGQSFGIQNGNNGNSIAWGVIYLNTFNNVRVTSRNAGFAHGTTDLHGSTIPAPAWGTAYYMVYEDNTINFVNWNGGPLGANYMGDTEYPFNYIVRFCKFNVNRVAGASTEVDGYDMHGNGDYAQALNGFGMIIHDNVFNYSGGSSTGVKLADVRGGVGSVIFNNSVTGQANNSIQVRADPYTSVEPMQTYFANNINPDGSQISVSAQVGSTGAPYQPAPVKSTNYFVGNTLAAILPNYTEIAYPHPLRGAVPAPVTAPLVTNGTTVPVTIGANPINLTTAGVYKLIGTVVAPDAGSDSFWIDFDSDPANDDTRCWDLTDTTTSVNETTTWRGTTTLISPKTWTLAAGAHTLYIDAREAAQISSVQFVLAGAATPTVTPTPLPPQGVHLTAPTR